MALNKLKFNSLNVTPTAGKTIGFNSSADGLEATLSGGSMTFISKTTISSAVLVALPPLSPVLICTPAPKSAALRDVPAKISILSASFAFVIWSAAILSVVTEPSVGVTVPPLSEPSSMAKKFVLAAGAVVKVSVLPDTVKSVPGFCITPPRDKSI